MKLLKKVIVSLMLSVIIFSSVSPFLTDDEPKIVEAKALTGKNITISGLDKIVDSKEKKLVTESEVRDFLENLVSISELNKDSDREIKYSYTNIDGGISSIYLKLIIKNNKLFVSTNFSSNDNSANIKKGFKPKPKSKPKPKLKNTTKVPYKKGGGSKKKDFINSHAYKKHKYNKKEKSTEKKTQYGKNVDVKKLRELTMKYPDQSWSTRTKNGSWRTFYRKEFKSNLSTGDSPTVHHRVIINKGDSSKSTQFPLYFKKKK